MDFPRNGISMPGFSKERDLGAMLGFQCPSGVGITPVLGPWWGFASQGEIPKIEAAPELFFAGGKC